MRKLLFVLVAGGLFALAAPALAADGTISGTVTHAADGTPVVGMWISATNTSTLAVSYVYGTGADGSYSITVAPGTYDVSNYLSVSTESGVSFIRQTKTLTVASGEAKSGQNFSVVRRGKFIGHVYASDGVTPIADAIINASNVAGSTSGYVYATTASNGSYIGTPMPSGDFTASATGTYTFSVSKPGYFGLQVTGVAFAADDASTTRDFTLTTGSTVSGTVIGTNGAGIAGATVTLTKSASGVPFLSTYTAVTNAAGAYTVSVYDLNTYNGSAVGDYTLSIGKTGYVTKTASISISADASTLTGNNMTLVTAGTITGTVKNSAKSGLAGVTVLADDGAGNTYSTTTNASGAYGLLNLSPSTRYTLTVTKTNYVGQKSYNVKVTSGAITSGRDFTLPTARTFSGWIKAASGNTVLEGATISLFKRNKTRSEIADFAFTSKSDGTFIFRNVSPGKYQVKIAKSGYVTAILDSVAIGSNVTGKIYKLDLGGSIFGRVTTGKNVAVPSADIAVFAMKNGKEVAYTATTSDENGYYQVSGLKQGVYRLKVTSTDYVTRIVNVNVKTGTQSGANIPLAPGGSVSGFLVDKETGLPVSAYIRVVGTSVAAWANANGYYILDGLATGKYQLNVVSAYYDAANVKNVPVVAGSTKTDINYTLNPK